MKDSSAQDIWQRKLDFLLKERAKAVDAADKFKLDEEIKEAQTNLEQLRKASDAHDHTRSQIGLSAPPVPPRGKAPSPKPKVPRPSFRDAFHRSWRCSLMIILIGIAAVWYSNWRISNRQMGWLDRVSYNMPLMLHRIKVHDAVIVEIDDAAVRVLTDDLATIRTNHLSLLRRLESAGPRLVFLDMAFSRPANDTNADWQLMEQIRKMKNVVIGNYREKAPHDSGVVLDEDAPLLELFKTNGITWGYVQAIKDTDGAIRRLDATVPSDNLVLITAVWQAAALITNIDSSTFSVDDLKDLSSFVNKLKQPTNAVSAYLRDTLSGTTRAALESLKGSRLERSQLQALLITNLNEIILGQSVYEKERFQSVVLRPETRKLQYLILQQNSQGADIIRLNRMLLEDAYPAEISRNPNLVHSFTKERWLNYYAPPPFTAFERKPYLQAKDPSSSENSFFSNKMVFVGVNKIAGKASEGRDVFPHPAGGYVAGVEVIATAVVNLVKKDWLSRIGLPWQLIIVAVWGVFISTTLATPHERRAKAIVAVATALLVVASFAAALYGRVWWPWMIPTAVQLPIGWVAYQRFFPKKAVR